MSMGHVFAYRLRTRKGVFVPTLDDRAELLALEGWITDNDINSDFSDSRPFKNEKDKILDRWEAFAVENPEEFQERVDAARDDIIKQEGGLKKPRDLFQELEEQGFEWPPL